MLRISILFKDRLNENSSVYPEINHINACKYVLQYNTTCIQSMHLTLIHTQLVHISLYICTHG